MAKFNRERKRRDILRRGVVFTTSLQQLFKVHKKIGARGVMVIVVGIGHDDTSSNPGRD